MAMKRKLAGGAMVALQACTTQPTHPEAQEARPTREAKPEPLPQGTVPPRTAPQEPSLGEGPSRAVFEPSSNGPSSPPSNLSSGPPPTTNAIRLAPMLGRATHLVVLLHGYGDAANSFQSIGRALQEALPTAEFLVPDGFAPSEGGGPGRQWFGLRNLPERERPSRVRQSGQEVSRWLDDELKIRSLAGDKLIVLGFSQGAMLTGWLALHRQPRPMAAVLLSGLVADDQPPSLGLVGHEGQRRPKVFVVHGDQDAVITVSYVKPSVRLLQAGGAQVTERVYPGLAHQVDGRVLRDVGLFLKDAIAAP